MDKVVERWGSGVYWFVLVAIALLGTGGLDLAYPGAGVSAWSVSRTTFFFWMAWKLLGAIHSGGWGMDFLEAAIPLSLILWFIVVTTSLLPDFHAAGDLRYLFFGCAHALMVMDLFKDHRRAYLLFVLLGLLPGLLTVRGLLNDPSVLRFDQMRRFGFPLDHPNTAGYIFSMSFPLAMALVVNEKRFWRGLGLSSCGLQLLGLILTYSRGAWLGWTASTFFLTVAWKHWKAAACIWVGLLLVFILVEPLRHRMLTLTRPQTDEAISDRIRVMRNALELGDEHPVLGIGYGRGRLKQALRHAYEGTADENSPIWHAHNVYVELFAETGILGLGAFLWLWAQAFFRIMRRAVSEKGEDAMILFGLAAAWVAAAVTGLGDVPFYHHETRIYFFTLLGLAAVVHSLAGRSSRAL